jgi:hypothetical protein
MFPARPAQGDQRTGPETSKSPAAQSQALSRIKNIRE